MYISILANISYTGYISSELSPCRYSRTFLGLLQTLQDCGSPPLASRAPTLSRPTSLRTSDRRSLLAYLGLPLDLFGKVLVLPINFADSSCLNVHRMHSSNPTSHCSNSTSSSLRPALSFAGARTRSCASRKILSYLLTLNHALLSLETPRLSEQLLLRPQTGSGWKIL
jgi:hypothetical protein